MAEPGCIGIIGGAGWLGSALARALSRSGLVGKGALICSYRRSRPLPDLDCRWTRSNADLVERSDVVIVSVRPSDWSGLSIQGGDKLIVSVMAGVTVDRIRARTGARRIARALPNAAAEVGASYTPFFMSSDRGDDARRVRTLFETCGLADEVGAEDQIDYFTAMSGSGAAFPALLARVLMDDAIVRGVPGPVARRAAQQLVIGAGRLQERHGASPAAVVQDFLDYRGTTAAGILGMLEAGFEASVRAGLEAAHAKVRALGG